jgi:hypothetical protein
MRTIYHARVLAERSGRRLWRANFLIREFQFGLQVQVCGPSPLFVRLSYVAPKGTLLTDAGWQRSLVSTTVDDRPKAPDCRNSPRGTAEKAANMYSGSRADWI